MSLVVIMLRNMHLIGVSGDINFISSWELRKPENP